MAVRPIFRPNTIGPTLVEEVPIQFRWHAGMAPVQKKKNVVELHIAAAERGLARVLEVSSKSERELGRKLSAFYLKIRIGEREVPLECAFQGSKFFEHGGPFTDLYDVDPRQAKKDLRLRNAGRLLGFKFEGKEYPLTPKTVFYDWLYLKAIYPHRDWLRRLDQCDGFSDIEFNPEKSVNCQARSCATFVSLQLRGSLDHAMKSFDAFRAASALHSI